MAANARLVTWIRPVVVDSSSGATERVASRKPLAMMGSAARPGSWRILVQPSKTVGKERTEAEGLSDSAAVTVTYSLLQIPLDSPLLYEDEIRSVVCREPRTDAGGGGCAFARAQGARRHTPTDLLQPDFSILWGAERREVVQEQRAFALAATLPPTPAVFLGVPRPVCIAQ